MVDAIGHLHRGKSLWIIPNRMDNDKYSKPPSDITTVVMHVFYSISIYIYIYNMSSIIIIIIIL